MQAKGGWARPEKAALTGMLQLGLALGTCSAHAPMHHAGEPIRPAALPKMPQPGSPPAACASRLGSMPACMSQAPPAVITNSAASPMTIRHRYTRRARRRNFAQTIQADLPQTPVYGAGLLLPAHAAGALTVRRVLHPRADPGTAPGIGHGQGGAQSRLRAPACAWWQRPHSGTCAPCPRAIRTSE